MSDIFISYKREDQPIAKELAFKLINKGFSVWWDRDIPVGKIYDQVIEEELAKAKCVIVLWTTKSVQSLNVKEEALEGLNRNILIPVALGKVQLPYGFKMIQTLSWNEDLHIDGDEFSELLKQINRLVNVTSEGHEKLPDNIKHVQTEQPTTNADHSNKQAVATLRFIKAFYTKAVIVSTNVYIDGRLAGKFSRDESLSIQVPPGNHVIEVRGGGALMGTRQTVNIHAGESISWRVGYSLLGSLTISRVNE